MRFLLFAILIGNVLISALHVPNDPTRGVFSFLFGERKTCHCKCGIPNRNERLLGGEFLKGHELPWLALVNIRGITNFGGVLINDRYILTAATPIIGMTPYELKVNLGVHDRCFPDVTSANVSVDQIYIHPDFSPARRVHDIALLRLSNVVPFERRINPICLPTPGASYVGQVGTVVGWSQGPSPEGDIVTTCRPRKVGLPVLGNECQNQFPEGERASLSFHQGCLGIIGALSVVCKTDAGGPVQFRTLNGIYEAIGVLTDFNDCSPKPSTSLYTKVNAHLSWIIRNTQDACYCQKL